MVKERPDLTAHAAPNGTVTILFSDVVASTAINERIGDKKWMQLLREHNDIIRRQKALHGGYEVKTIGDAFMLAFRSATAMLEFDELRSLWKPYQQLNNPPFESIRVWSQGGCGIWVSGDWGPAVPYPPVDHRNGHLNHGYLPLKGNAEAISLIPEVKGWTELQRFLEAVNAGSSPIESVGCEKGFFSGDAEGTPSVKLGSYVDVIFTDRALNDCPQNHFRLASALANAIEGCENWGADVSFVLQRSRALAGARMPWGLILQMKNYGRSEEEARKFWAATLFRLGKAITELAPDFPLAK